MNDNKIVKLNIDSFDELPNEEYLMNEYKKDIDYLINNPKFFENNKRIMYISKYQTAGVYSLFKEKYPLYNFSKSYKQYVNIFKLQNNYSPLFNNLNIPYYYDLYHSLKMRIKYFEKLLNKNIKYVIIDDSHGRILYFLLKMAIKKNYDYEVIVFSNNDYDLLWKKLTYPKDVKIIKDINKYDFLTTGQKTKYPERIAQILSIDYDEDFIQLFKSVIKLKSFSIMLNFYVENIDINDYSKLLKTIMKKFSGYYIDDYFIAFNITEKDKELIKSIINI